VIAVLILLPLLAGGTAFLLRNVAARRGLLVGTAVAHLALTACAWVSRPPSLLSGSLALDEAGLLFLSISSGLFLIASWYAVGYLRREPHVPRPDFEEGDLFTDAPEAVFIGCLLFFLASMTLVAASHHFGLLWIGIEATTLATAPLIYFHRHHRSLEATWKYLLVCSVGIALALLGNFFLGVAAARPGGDSQPLVLARLLACAGDLNAGWVKAGFLMLLVGYGTKMGLAPLHTWLPDAHSEAPSVVSALLSGALLNSAFLGILRAQQVCAAAGLSGFTRDPLLALGLGSMAVAAVFILGQTDYKRMLAYSSVEHMGILAFGVGLGATGAFGSMLHTVNHSLAKAMLFLVAGNVLAAYRTKSIREVRGLQRRLPWSGALWVTGFLAITGVPPFGLFLSEFAILRAALEQGHPWLAAGFLVLLAVIFAGMATAVLRMAQGNPPHPGAGAREPVSAVIPPAILGVAVLGLGLWVPAGLRTALHQIAATLAGG
jgi:hydrogenase-4 component F